MGNFRMSLVGILLAVVASVGVQEEPAPAISAAQPSQPVVDGQYCSTTRPGAVQVVFRGNPSREGQQWLDLSLSDSGFSPGTFVSVGPLSSDAASFAWDGIAPAKTHYVRVNTFTPAGWSASPAASFGTGICPVPTAALGTAVQECSSTQAGRVKVTFTWTPGASVGTTQYVDLSVLNNGFAPGTFMAAGPLEAAASSLIWDGLLPNTTHYWRVNTLGGAGWRDSVAGSFATSSCGVTWAPLPATPPLRAWFEGVLVAQDGQYLGVVTCNPYEADGIFNKYGQYGSKYWTDSIWNKYGQYGSRYSLYSPFNKYSLSAPQILGTMGFVGYLSVNPYLYLAIDPWDIVFYCFGNDPSRLGYWADLLSDRTS